MGTNYYLVPQPPCPHCGRPYESRHIGKSSAGWCFALHVYPDEGICNLEDWRREWDGKQIIDGYGREITAPELLSVIDRRGRLSTTWDGPPPERYRNWDHFHRYNESEFGPCKLLRPQAHCYGIVGYGEDGGTWYYVTGEFS